MEYSFEAKVVVTMNHNTGDTTSTHVATDLNLSLSKNLKHDQYLDYEDLPTAAGTKALTHTLVQGLVGNIHQAEQNGFKPSAEHLREIIADLERGLIQVAEVSKSTFSR